MIVPDGTAGKLHRRCRAGIVRALVVLLVTGWASAAAAQESGDRELELRRIRDEIARLESQLGRMEERESSLEDRLRRVELELELQESRLGEAGAALALVSARIAAAEVKVTELTAALEATRGDLRRRLAGLYRLGGQGYLRLILSLRPDRDVLPAVRQLRFLVRRDRLAFDRYRSTRERLEDQQRLLSEERREAELWQQREEERRDEMLAVRRRHQRLLRQVEDERRRLATRVDELQDKERKLVRLIDSLLAGRLTPVEGTPIQEFRGVLDWPAEGEVTVEFGPRRDPRYQTEVPHNGLDIALAAESEVRAVFPGRVLYASEFEGYGTMVVVYHPGRVFTLYAGLTSLSVAKDDVLSLGDVLGRASETVYFEIRSENKPEDPRRWLR